MLARTADPRRLGLVFSIKQTGVPAGTALAGLIVPPLAIITLTRALRGQFDRHRRIARWTLPIWLYVSVTGVIVYWMLYRLYPPR